MTVKTTRHQMRVTRTVQTTGHVPQIISSVKTPTSVLNPTGCVTGTMIAGITQMRMPFSVPNGHVLPTVSDVPKATVVYPPHGTATGMMIVGINRMNLKTIVKVKREHVSVTSSRVIMGIVYPAYTFVTVTTIASIILTRIPDTSVTRGSVMLTGNSHVLKTETGAGHSVYPNDGFVTGTLTAWMGLTRIQPSTPALRLPHANRSNSGAGTRGASTRTGYVIMTMIAATAQMKTRTAPSGPVLQKNSPVPTLNASARLICATGKMIVAIILMKMHPSVKMRPQHVPEHNSDVKVDSASRTKEYAISNRTVMISRMNRVIVMWMNVQNLIQTSANISVSILLPHTTVSVTMATDS